MLAGRDISIAAVVDEVKTHQENDPSSKQYDKIVHENQTVVGATVAAGGNLAIKAGAAGAGALAIAGSNISGGGSVSLAASGDVSITQVQENHLSDIASHRESKSTFKKSSDTTADYSSVSAVVGSSVSGGAVTVKSGNDIVIGGSQLTAENALTLNAGRDLLVSSAEQAGSESHSAEHMKSGFSFSFKDAIGYTKSQDKNNASTDTITQLGSVLSGGSVTATSGRDTTISGSTVVADRDISIDAGRDVSIVSAENSVDGASASSSKKSGSIGSGFQPAVGTVKTANDGTADSVTQVGSQIASLNGDIMLKAGGKYTQTSSEVTTPAGNIAIVAKDVLINTARNVSNSTDHMTYSKTAIGGTISSPVLDAAKSVGGMVKAAQGTSDSRMQALAALNVAATVAGMPTSLAGVKDGGLRVSISLGNSKSENTVVTTSNTVAGSTINAGGNVSITATGAGNNSNLTAIGSDITAGGNVALSADNDVSLLAAENTASQHSTNKSSGASIGVGFGIGGASNGFTIDLAVSKARGKADGDDIGYTNTHVKAGNNVTVVSGGDTTLRGGVIAADSVVADIGGDLNIESLQDSSKFDSKQTSAGLNASLCIPPACYGASTVGGSFSKSKVNGDFLSVLEQSGIKAGDGGFQVTVRGNTDLKGGVLSSSQVAIDQSNNLLATGSLTASDLQNKDEYSASGFSISGSVSGKLGDQSTVPDHLTNAQKKAAAADVGPGGSAGFGSASGSQSSTTFSAISGGSVFITDQSKQTATGKSGDTVLTAVDRNVTSENGDAKAGSLVKSWDGKQLQSDVDAQIAITSEFGKLAAKKVGDFADEQRDNALLRGDLAAADKWDEGGAYRVAAHAAVGAVAGGVNGAFGAAASAIAAPQISELIADMGLPDEVRKLVIAAASSGVAALAGGAGLASGYNQVENNFLMHEQAAAMKKEFDQCGKKAGGCTDVEYLGLRDKYLALSNQNIAQVQSCVLSGNVACVSAIEGKAATTSELSPDVVGADFTIFAGRQNNVLSYQSVYGAASLFGTDLQQATEIAKFRLTYCGGVGSTACDSMVKDALADQKARVAILMAAGTVLPLASQATKNGLRSLRSSEKNATALPPEKPLDGNKTTVDAEGGGKTISDGKSLTLVDISLELEQKILFGQRTSNKDGTLTNRIIGAHGGEISDDLKNYAVEVNSVNADGTRNAKIIMQFEDGNISNIKKSTLFPEKWSNEKVIEAVKITAESQSLGTRAIDGTSLFQATIDGVKVEVLKIGNKVTSAYPCGKNCSDPSKFVGK